MKLEELYRKAVLVGISKDMRDKKEIGSLLREEKKKFDELKKEDKEFFDQDRLFNPFADTRILNGNKKTEVKKLIVGIDVEVGEILLTHFLNQTGQEKIDCVISHHPEGYALAQLYDVMKLQADILASFGVTMSVAEQLMEKRIGEIERRLLPVNHNRTIDASRLLGIPLICIHTPADNCVTRYLLDLFNKEKPNRLQD
ncbi:MAG: NGG1p interacting factor NIF3, partial [Acidobacteriota bacterium]